MVAIQGKPKFSESSLSCRRSLPSTVTATSHAIGWTSVLIDRHWVEPSDEPFDTLATPDHSLVVMTRGEQIIESLRAGSWRSFIYRVGTVGMMPSGETVRLRRRIRRNPAPFEKANLYVPQSFLQDAADHLRRPGQGRLEGSLQPSTFEDPLVTQTVLALLRAMAAGAPDMYAETAMQWLAMHLLSTHDTGRDDPRRPGNISDRRLNRVVDHICANLEKPLTLERLATEAGVSKFHFARLFRCAMGVTPHAFLLRSRMEAATRLLRTSDLPIGEVAARCGFPRAAHFGAAFTRHAGVSPTAFRGRLPR